MVAKTTITLAYPLDEAQSAALGLDRQHHWTGQRVTMQREYARSVINAGFAQVDPTDGEQVRRALAESGTDNAAASQDTGGEEPVGDTEDGTAEDTAAAVTAQTGQQQRRRGWTGGS